MIGKVIRMYRKRKGYSINQLADIAGVSKSYLSKIERGVHRNPSVEFLKKISHALKVELKELFDTEVILYRRAEHDEEWRTHLVEAVQAGMNQEELFQFTHRLRQQKKERTFYRSRQITQANIDDWRALMTEAKELGLTIQEVKAFLMRARNS
ncbi:transcriptional regulator [Bacillus glycinifermentans]|uniref:Helix-turn-helix domain-containing protein n=1 Tax=Bacillus glycinifermentans TaxID=1664069 RepID=A0A0J6EJD1_9BACI|nr:helix-turn-helix domain-containing protein [Bacillus glycinifermentans]ATH93270.1 transcriptional regulator [Bacillus glycinifermentans]KMM58357.1 transcriptional regulator [Bacillus glycinifermentans]KRT88350.1 transcriptional regulator [Bacillus glycinifermentans]MEC0483337.1 helix-turn-helix domain-containing protein [Bacillus glycinifermentans]MEC0493760.1 helix-turn-helix domain-containing protein [Bacillus glycinifermentans]